MIERSWLVEAGRWSNVCQICTRSSTRGSEVRQTKDLFWGEDPRSRQSEPLDARQVRRAKESLKHSVNKVCVPNLHIAHFLRIGDTRETYSSAGF